VISYWMLVNHCRWVYVTTSRAIWAALPHVVKPALIACVGVTAPATPVSNGRAHGVIPPAVVRDLPPGAFLQPDPVRVPEPAGLAVLGVALVGLGVVVRR
jgi:hypothetical protein